MQLGVSLAVATCIAAGCASNAIPVSTHGPDGKAAIALDCSGEVRNWNHCLQAAGDACKARGYAVLDRSDQHPTQLMEVAFKRSMLIRCN